MRLFDETIKKFQTLLNVEGSRKLPVGDTGWPEVSDRSMILRSDMAYELGGEGQALYQAIRNLEYTRYHFYPEGFMMRVSASRAKEAVRIGKDALKRGLDFTKTGNRMISAFHRNTSVEAVHLYYVTQEAYDYKALKHCAEEAESITKTIDHILKSTIMDCGACSLQKVCDEVEGLRELHFRR